MRRTFVCVLVFLFFCNIRADSYVLPTEKYDSMEVPPRTHDLIKQEYDKKESENLKKIENVVEKVTDKHEQKKSKKRAKLNDVVHTGKNGVSASVGQSSSSIWDSLKNSALEIEIRHTLESHYQMLSKINKTVSLNLKKADIKTVFNLISKLTDTKFLVDQDVYGDVENIDLNEVALPAVVRLLTGVGNVPLAVINDCDTWRITKLATAIDMFKLSAQEALDNDYLNECLTIVNAKWDDGLKKRIECLWNGIIGEKGKNDKCLNYLVFEDNTHKILFKAKTDHVETFKKFLKEIDVEIPQVKIDIRVIVASKDFEESIGFDWSGYYDRRNLITHTDFVGMGAKEDPDIATMFKEAATWSMNFVPAFKYFKDTASRLRLPFLIGNKDFSWNRWNIIINAAENKGEVKTVLKPTLLVNNDEWAEILVGQEMPHETKIAETVEGQPSNISTTQYKDIGMKIKIKSIVAPNKDAAFLDIFVENSYITRSRFDFKTLPSQEKEGFNYVIETSRSKNRVLLKSGYTTLLSGLITNIDEKVNTGIPYLQDIPVLGWVFQGNRKAHVDRQLLIFITPTVL